MQDRFMFRAWDNTYKRFIFRTLIDAKETSLSWEQCTGLKDKNGRLIYEGDIVKLSGKFGVYPIVYNESCCDYDLTKNGKFIYEFYWKVAENCEVIGNIHENPELLEA